MKKLFSILILVLFPAMLTAQEQFSVFFESNKYDLTKKEQGRLQDWISANATSKVLAINGYTDEDGTIGLNDTLSQRRVTTVFGAIKGKVPARSDFKTRSFGKLHKQSPVKAENRKVTIYFLQEKDLARENEVLGITETPKPTVPSKPKGPVNYPATVMAMGPGGKEEELKLDQAFMKQLGEAKTGEKIRIPNLNFYENTFGVMPDSRPRLFELLEVMKANPQLKIKLQGHVCCMKADRNNLSTQRAKAIMMFLNKSGIDKSRLSFEGFGVSQPMYPIPEKDADEREANRRVEVLIVEN
ncbi:OmpA family protein [Flavobacterium subsaxonicum]|uniref:Cell envelope biogenesis protein OmpA n=1 Tax=Flavobacterium subsaxonicum WB 4.1-42 = DSM 21790 TaxID=1121898 RepID=A0A0A2MM35_9FLAO|nr:OmpA family protein [Flavobacterium subsaxonicum]KGO92553.1 cell envelope biogenesis protein OmpA [Flavobacterium subsaxonicum WB 4.1-42 = DSM 21790]